MIARDEREHGYFLVNGVVVHGIVGLVEGQRITPEEAQEHCARKRAEEAAALTAEDPPASASIIYGRLAELEAKNAQLEADMQKLLALAAKGFAA